MYLLRCNLFESQSIVGLKLRLPQFHFLQFNPIYTGRLVFLVNRRLVLPVKETAKSVFANSLNRQPSLCDLARLQPNLFNDFA